MTRNRARTIASLTLLLSSFACNRHRTTEADTSSAPDSSLVKQQATAKTPAHEPAQPSATQPSATQPSATQPSGDAATTAKNRSIAILAGGCFWGMEEILRGVPGVIDTEVGYTGGTKSEPGYDAVSSGSSGHAEAIRIVFDPTKLSYAELLEKWFFRMHDPTTKNRQGNDVGTQYRSAVFVTSPEQRRIAQQVKERVDESGKWEDPVVTEIADAGPFFPAETYHQDYLQKNPGGYTCHYLRD